MIDIMEALENAVSWARYSGEIQNGSLGSKDIKVTTKSSEIDLVTIIDKECERYIVDSICSKYPEHGILSEESGELIKESDFRWIIDPLDGTTNYAHGLPVYAVSIALEHKGNIVLGVVYAPYLDEMFWAVKGFGAFMNGASVSVATYEGMKKSLLATGFPYNDSELLNSNIEYFSHFQRKSRGIRRFGSAAYDLCCVACGRLSGYWELGLSLWDIAAGKLIVEEAGGKVEAIEDKGGESIVAGCAHICSEILSEIAKIDSGR